MEEKLRIINELIKKDKLKFKFLDENKELDVLQVCYNKKEETIEIEFRNTVKEYVEELKKLIKKFWNILSKNVEKDKTIC